MGVVITITNGGGSAEPVRVSDGTNAVRIYPGQESYSIEVPQGGELTIGALSLYAEAKQELPPPFAKLYDGDNVTVLFADGATEVDGSPGTASVTDGVLENVKLSV